MTGVAEIFVGLLLAVAVLALVARQLTIPYPILFVIGGLLLGWIPKLPKVRLDPELVFLFVLPPLLFPAALFTSWRDFRANLRPISLLAIGLVLFTTVAVAYLAHYFMGLPLAAGFVLGAIISPPDAIAATAIADRLGVPRRIVVILEGESLVNDATALVAYRFAVIAVATGSFSLVRAGGQFLVVGNFPSSAPPGSGLCRSSCGRRLRRLFPADSRRIARCPARCSPSRARIRWRCCHS